MTMTVQQLKQRLTDLGVYDGIIDNSFDAVVRVAILKAMENGPDTPLSMNDYQTAAEQLRCDMAAIMAVRTVEASGHFFIEGMPPILFEPHRFSRATGHRFDATFPRISSRHWDRSLYPSSQKGRWTQLLDAVSLDVDAGFASASYGGFQILGENYAICGTQSPFDFAWQESRDEAHQLKHFINFVQGNGLDRYLRTRDWAKFARGYNGTAYAQNHYDTRLAAAYAKAKVNP